MKIIKNWEDLKEISKTSKSHYLEVNTELGGAELFTIEGEYVDYLSTHSIYDYAEETNDFLRDSGFENFILDNCSMENKLYYTLIDKKRLEDETRLIRIKKEYYEIFNQLCDKLKEQEMKNVIFVVQTKLYRPCSKYEEPEYFCIANESDIITQRYTDKNRLKEDFLKDLEDEVLLNKFNFCEFDFEFNNLLKNNDYILCEEVAYYEDRAYFLTEEEASKYKEYQSHNLNCPIIADKSLGYRNHGYFPKILEILNNFNLEEKNISIGKS